MARARTTPARTTVRLTGIALRHQGSHDSLCAYYAAAMLLCALRPEFEEEFDATHVARDPLFAHLPRRRAHTVERVAAEWLAAGVALGPLGRALDAACRRGPERQSPRTRFRHRRAPADERTLAFLRAQVDSGLPCLVGWESGELGNHTSLVVGYERWTRGGWWLRLLDPIRMLEQLEWRQLTRFAAAPLDLIYCAAHDGTRPDKLTVARNVDGAPVETHVQRWDPRAAAWLPLY